MAGSVRPSQFGSAIRRPVLELPVDQNRSLMDFWQEQIAQLAATIGSSKLPVRIMFDKNAKTLPAPPQIAGSTQFSIERDPSDIRGTGGVLRDITRVYDGDDYVLVANGAQVLVQSLDDLSRSLAALHGDVGIISHLDGTPSGIMLVRCGVLDDVSAVGFQDMKEQVLPRIAQKFDIRVAHFEQPTGVPIRSLSDYIRALSIYHQARKGVETVDPFAENLKSLFAIVHPQAHVDSTAKLHDSVVLPGGRVEAGAVLVRSIVCPGAVVRRDQRVVERIVAGGRSSEGAR
jgi:NDP-sugar pyrophosphorylase family protein